MGVKVFESEVAIALPPKRFFKAIVYDLPHLVVKIMPNVVKSAEFAEGNGGVGSIKLVKLHEGVSSVTTFRERVEAVDEEKLFYSLTVIEGEFAKGVEKVQNNLTFEAAPDGAGTVLKRKSHYFYSVSDDQIDEAGLKAADENANGMFKGIEAYLLANPDA